ncbi:alpha/beta hydrolase [Nocardia goodfellowii]
MAVHRGRRIRPASVGDHGSRHGRCAGDAFDAYAERFAAAGWSVLVFDYRHLGASGGQPRQLVDIGKQLDDWHAALAFARSLPDVDRDRIALWGTSFGGGHVMRVASEDRRVAAVVAQCPFSDGRASLIARLRVGPAGAVALTAAGVLDTVASRLGAAPLLMPMAGASWMPAFVASPDAVAGASALLPRGTRLSRRASSFLRRLPALRTQVSGNIELTDGAAHEPATRVGRDPMWGVLRGPDNAFDAANALAARLVLRLAFYRPGRALARSSVPTLLCVCDDDAAAPAETTRRHADGLAHVQVRNYPCDHFDIYVDDHFDRVIGDQIAFLTEQFAGSVRSTA